MSGSEVASYVLAYLLQNNFKATATAFLQECDSLPSKTFLVLPETPLQVVISEHKARLHAKVLVNTLGSEPAWQELWSKLNTTLHQIKCLSEDMNRHHFQPAPKIKAQKLFGNVTKKSLTQSGDASKGSPNKRKQGSCRRIYHSSSTSPTQLQRCAKDFCIGAVQSGTHNDCSGSSKVPIGQEVGPPNSPTVQQVLDTFLDETFPGKLASIINQCVSSSDTCLDDLSSEMSSETLERILNVTLAEPMLETVLPQTNTEPLSEPTQPSLPSCSLATTSTVSPMKNASKRQRLEDETCQELYPSEQDIDSFLDQIHQ